MRSATANPCGPFSHHGCIAPVIGPPAAKIQGLPVGASRPPCRPPNEGSKIMQKKGGRTQDHAADMAAGWRIRPAPPEQRDRRCSGAKPMERSPPMLSLSISFDKPEIGRATDRERRWHTV